MNYADNDNITLIKGTHIKHEMYKDIQFIRDERTSFYEVICTKNDNTQCHLYVGYDGTDARRTYNRIIAAAEDTEL
ncbi:MAG: hypothetical protein BZ137_09360 [Methanosphaera sp. rholeuAM130]|nr:hypothetical protein [Methanosphaera sp.]RAP51985.1 MAG: hypothetical protein BZ137_09360 [Methanosphaera sp. rholeuAM130]